jgi:hypothetical protein
MLVPRKLKAIRDELLKDSDFAFPNSVLLILSDVCSFDERTRALTIPKRYGSVNVVDGQHRLFAYANDAVKKRMKNNGHLLATALYFEKASAQEIEKFSARTFIEINTNQTKVTTLHLEGIAYELLGNKDARSIAAHILRKLNDRQNKVHGVFRTSDSPTGALKITEVVGALARVTNDRRIAELQGGSGATMKVHALGYKHLFGFPPKELKRPKELVAKGIITLERYFNLAAKVFKHDFPTIEGRTEQSAFELTKMFAALVLLFDQFVQEGMDWHGVERELNAILINVMKLRKVATYDSILFKVGEPEIPNARPRIKDDFNFLNANRIKPTPITALVTK